MRTGILLVLFALGCVRSESHVCAWGTCPAAQVCDDLHQLCVFPDQLASCVGHLDGDACMVEQLPGVCDRGVCIGVVCGDGALQPSEDCDCGTNPAALPEGCSDVNGTASCRADCRSVGCGNLLVDIGEGCDDGNTIDHDGCASMCRDEAPTWTQWQPGWTGVSTHVVAFDSGRSQFFLFGGFRSDGDSNETWVLAPGSDVWTKLDTPSAPSSRRVPGMAYDPIRQRIVLFGGLKNGLMLGDTWELDPVARTWTQVTPLTSPPPRGDAALAYNPFDNRIVLFGGRLDVPPGIIADTWEYNGTSWVETTPTPSPPPRLGHVLTWNSGRGGVMVVGGGGVAMDTWLYNGSAWTNLAPTNLPGARFHHGVGYLPGTPGRLVVFGGGDGTGYYGDTWELADNASTWTQRSLAVSPSARWTHAIASAPSELMMVGGAATTLSSEVWRYTTAGWQDRSPPLSPKTSFPINAPTVYDKQRNEIILFFAETWAFDGDTWHLRVNSSCGSACPVGRDHHGLAYDTIRGRTVLFGGFNPALLGDTWEWNGTSWTQGPSSGPTSRRGPAMAYHEGDRVTVLFGGGGGGNDDKTWLFDGTSWTSIATDPTPPLREFPAIAYDPDRDVLVMMGGTYVNGPLGDTWTYRAGVWTQLADTPALARFGHRLAWDANRRRMILFGGTASDATTYELVGSAWEPLPTGSAPPARAYHGMAMHEATNQIVVFGGGAGGGIFALDDTWLFQFR